MGLEKNVYDVESHSPVGTDADEKALPAYAYEDGAVPGESFVAGNSLYHKLQRFVGKYGVEQRGIERVPEDERTDTNLAKVGTMLGFVDAILTTLFINLLGILPVCFFSTFGPVFGLRQMVLSRFFFGWWGVKISKYPCNTRSKIRKGNSDSKCAVAIFNILACVGWSSVNVIVGAQLLNAVNSDVPGYAGIIIIAAATFLVTLFGYRVVHYYEFYSWIPSFIIFLIVLGEFAHSGAFVNLPMKVGNSEAGGVLSYAASVFGFATGWTSYAADYTVYQPRTVSRVKTFAWTWIGLIFPLLFTEFLGVAVATAMTFDPVTFEPTNSYAVGYDGAGIGGLLAAVLFPPLGRFGQFCLVILALSIIANNCPNIYSVGLSLQVLGRWTQAVPRFVWTFVGTLVYCAIAIPGYSHFESVLENFMLVIVSFLPLFPPFSPLVNKSSSSRATGSPSTKPSPYPNTSSSRAGSADTTHPSTRARTCSHRASPPSWHFALASSAPSWAWRSSGSLALLANISARRGMEAILGSSSRSRLRLWRIVD
ncbi:MAG: hypothetical protein Q9190_004482 [Brigantiaea leucoxantha]